MSPPPTNVERYDSTPYRFCGATTAASCIIVPYRELCVYELKRSLYLENRIAHQPHRATERLYRCTGAIINLTNSSMNTWNVTLHRTAERVVTVRASTPAEAAELALAQHWREYEEACEVGNDHHLWDDSVTVVVGIH